MLDWEVVERLVCRVLLLRRFLLQMVVLLEVERWHSLDAKLEMVGAHLDGVEEACWHIVVGYWTDEVGRRRLLLRRM